LHWAGVNQIDGILLTHGDSLHIGGAQALLGDYLPNRLIDNPAVDRSTIHLRLHEIFSTRGLFPLDLQKTRTFAISSDATARILFPPSDFSSSSADDQALVVQVTIRPDTDFIHVR